jgi:hypothetical protein
MIDLIKIDVALVIFVSPCAGTTGSRCSAAHRAVKRAAAHKHKNDAPPDLHSPKSEKYFCIIGPLASLFSPVK